MGSMRLNQAQNEVFCHFVKFRSCVFLAIAYRERLQQYVTSSGGKTNEKKFWGEDLDQPEISFFAIFSSLVH